MIGNALGRPWLDIILPATPSSRPSSKKTEKKSKKSIQATQFVLVFKISTRFWTPEVWQAKPHARDSGMLRQIGK